MKQSKLLSVLMSVCLIIGVLFAADYVIKECFVSSGKENLETDVTVTLENEYKELRVDLLTASLVIEKGESFSLSTTSRFISYTSGKTKLVINEKARSIKELGGTVTLTIPENYKLEKCRIETGAGSFKADDISCDTFIMNQGAGLVEIGKLIAEKSAKINGGAGKITVLGGKLNNARIDIGVGNLKVCSLMTGNSKIDSGIGKTELILSDSKDIYSFDIDKGVGAVSIDGEQSEGGISGDGANLIKIDGDVGAINISFE